jgi:chemotaxis protein CheX
MNPASPPAPALIGREGWLPTLRLAMQEVFELMLACPLEVPQKPPPDETLDITSMVALAGQLSGVLTVRCSAKSAARMAARMLGIDAERAGPEVFDAVGEICNMVAGNFKNKIAGLGDGCMLSVPTVITGPEYRLHSTSSNEMQINEKHNDVPINDEMQIVLLFEGEPVVLTLKIHG